MTVFRKKSLVDPSTIVDENRIYGRDNQLDTVISVLKKALDDAPPNDMLLHGLPGTGKSLIANIVAKKLVKIGEEQNKRFEVINVKCSKHRTEAEIAYSMVKHLAEQMGEATGIPESGVATSDKYGRFFDLIRGNLDLTIIILDDLDKLVDNNRVGNEPAFSHLLYILSRASDIGDLRDEDLVIAALTSDPESLSAGLDSRVESSFWPRGIPFNTYTQDQLNQILEKRRDAFRDGCLDDGTLSYISTKAVETEENARSAIELLRESGEVADERGDNTVTRDHVDAASDMIQYFDDT